MKFSAADHGFMAQALTLAQRGLNTTSPNPRVGCVLVNDGRTLAEGWHEKAGGPHAEIAALTASRHTPEGVNVLGATAYVTLEPCNHFGRTPPCVDALITAGVGRVVVAMQDPNPLVSGQGLARLAATGIVVECGLLENDARELNVGFHSRMTRGRPWLRLKVAASFDGRTALKNGASQWITGPDARRAGHAWRARSCAVLTGIGTVKEDNPRLTVRDIETPRQPLKVVIDSRLETPLDAAVLNGGNLLIVAAIEDERRANALREKGAEVIYLPNAQGKVDLTELMQELGRRGLNEVLVEAGSKLNGSLMREGCVDELLIYQAPILLGDSGRGMFDLGDLTRMADVRRLVIAERKLVGTDVFVRARWFT